EVTVGAALEREADVAIAAFRRRHRRQSAAARRLQACLLLGAGILGQADAAFGGQLKAARILRRQRSAADPRGRPAPGARLSAQEDLLVAQAAGRAEGVEVSAENVVIDPDELRVRRGLLDGGCGFGAALLRGGGARR